MKPKKRMKTGDSATAPGASADIDVFQPRELPTETPGPALAAGSDGASAWQRYAINAVREGDFLTNDIIELRGTFDKHSSRELKVNGGTPVKLDRRGFVLLRILSAFALHVDSLRQQGRAEAAQYLSVPAILKVISLLTAEGAPLAGLWPSAIDSDVHRSMGKLRKQLRGAGWPSLIQSGQRGAGYRLSTPAANLVWSHDENNWIAAVRQVLETVREA